MGIWVHELVDGSGRLMVGGVQTYVLALAQAIDSWGARVHVLHPGPELASEEGAVHPWVRSVPPAEWKAGAEGRAYDVSIAANCHARPRSLPGRSVGVQHGIYWDRPSATVPSGLGPVGRIASVARAVHHYRVLDRYDHLVCVDYNFANSAAALQPPFDWAKISVIPNFAPESPEPDFGSPVRRLVFSRRFVRHRGTGVFAESVVRLRRAGWHGPVDIYGEGPEEESLRAALGGMDGVSWSRLPYRRRLEAFSPDALAVVPSLSTEGTSLTCLEAWAGGALVVSTPVGGLSNMVVDGVTGFLAAPDARAFSDVLLRVLDLPLERLSEIRRSAFRASQRSFGWARWQEAWASVLAFGRASQP